MPIFSAEVEKNDLHTNLNISFFAQVQNIWNAWLIFRWTSRWRAKPSLWTRIEIHSFWRKLNLLFPLLQNANVVSKQKDFLKMIFIVGNYDGKRYTLKSAIFGTSITSSTEAADSCFNFGAWGMSVAFNGNSDVLAYSCCFKTSSHHFDGKLF